MKAWICIGMLLAGVTGFGQNSVEGSARDTIKLVMESMPEFEGGIFALGRYLSQELIYPAESLENRVEGVVRVNFRVNKDGSISHVTVADSVAPMLDKEAVRLISSMPSWSPAMKDGEAAIAYVELPIRFRVPSLKKRRKMRREARKEARMKEVESF